MILTTSLAGAALPVLAVLMATPVLALDYAAQLAGIMDTRVGIENNAGPASETDRLKRFIDLQFQYTMLEFPEFATYIGHPEGHDRWTDKSRAAVARREQDDRNAMKVIDSINSAALSGADHLNYDLLRRQLVERIEGQRFGGNYIPVTQLGGPQHNLPRMLSMMPARSESDYESLLARLRGAAKQIDDTITWMKAGLEAGVTPPKITLRNVPLQVEKQIVEDGLSSPLLKAFSEFPDSMDQQARDRLIRKAVTIYQQSIRSAYQRLLDFLVQEYIPAARETIAISALPDGQNWYAYNVKRQTTTTLSPQAIHEIGLAEVERIRSEMEAVRELVGFEGDLQAFSEFLRTDPQFFFTSREALLSAYRDIAKRADPELVKVFGKLPRTPYGVEPVPGYAERSQPAAYYLPGSLEAGRPGIFFANTYALDTRPRWEMEALTLHEAVPGHHLQIAIQQELDNLAWFRRFGGYTAFNEGWALYSESLGVEMGFYSDYYSRFGRLSYEMWRAVRLVVDTGIHSRGWSRQQAIDYFKANTGKSEHEVMVEVDRYIVWPGQALAYKIGELKIRELRARASEKLGDHFDLRAFHDHLLGQGALPLSVLERHMNEWIAAQL